MLRHRKDTDREKELIGALHQASAASQSEGTRYVQELKDLKIGDFVEFVDRAPRIDLEPQTVGPDETHWAVCQTFSNRVHRVRPEIEKANRGTFVSTYARLWIKSGLAWSKERQLMPGYVFFRTKPKKWGAVRNIEGVYSVLTNNELACKVMDDEMRRLVVEHATGVHNEIAQAGVEGAKRRYSKRRRRPRAGKRMRGEARAA